MSLRRCADAVLATTAVTAFFVWSSSFVAPGSSLPQAAAQNPSCVRHSYGNEFDGYTTAGSSNYAGSYGYLTTQQALLCTSDTSTKNFSTAWVMLASNTGQNFGQVGYFETYGRGTHQFTAWQEDANGYSYSEYDDWTDTIGPGSTYQYAATKAENNLAACTYSPNRSCITFLINGQLFGESSDFPWDTYIDITAFPQPDRGEFFGETYYYTSDVPGTYTHAQFASLAWMSAAYARSNDFGSVPLGSVDTDTYWYRQSALSAGPTFTIWDGLS